MVESGVVKLEDVDTIFVNWKDIIACNNTFLRYAVSLHFSRAKVSKFIVEEYFTRALRIRKKMSPGGVVQAVGDILIDCVGVKLIGFIFSIYLNFYIFMFTHTLTA